jgi:hypothetical protein
MDDTLAVMRNVSFVGNHNQGILLFIVYCGQDGYYLFAGVAIQIAGGLIG